MPLLLFISLDTLAQYAAPVTDTLKWKNIASRYNLPLTQKHAALTLRLARSR
jgi:hypothetical protein